jgi:hypothetical protein
VEGVRSIRNIDATCDCAALNICTVGGAKSEPVVWDGHLQVSLLVMTVQPVRALAIIGSTEYVVRPADLPDLTTYDAHYQYYYLLLTTYHLLQGHGSTWFCLFRWEDKLVELLRTPANPGNHPTAICPFEP